LHVVAHIGNGHQQPPAFAAPNLGGLAVHRIVKVARVFAVNGDQGHVAQVNALHMVNGPHAVWQAAGLSQCGIRKLVRYVVFAHRNLNFHAGVVHLTEHLFHPPHGLAVQGRRLGQFHHHHLPSLGGADGALGDQDILAVALVFGGDQPDTAFLQQTANDGGFRPFDNFGDTAFGPAFAIQAHDASLDPVFVQDRPHFVRR